MKNALCLGWFAAFALLNLSIVSARADDDDRWRCGRVVAEPAGAANPYRLESDHAVTYRLLGMTSHDGVVLRYLRESLLGLMDLSREYCVAGPERWVSETETDLRIYKIKAAGRQSER